MPLVIGLTGGIGAGKSAVLERFRELGAMVVDSDDVAREMVAPGTPGLAAVVARFGTSVLRGDGSIDRPALAAIVFSDDAARADLEAITHPLVRAEVRRRVSATPSDAIVVNAVPLLVETGIAGEYDRVVVVEAPVEQRVLRLARARGMTRGEALARMAAQASDDERRAVAWRVIVNDGSLDDLNTAVDQVWAALRPGDEAEPVGV
ncbi:MAG TPA: dephospho-CoA kinase [Acidothermaceae bacterium]|jgi:dephospho-CoA kinase